ncbi:hypothetical protein BVRB_5g108040 [Beta vulgaris subsp. vulgaris]|nr:hypothetical protein BVRB_5g108040 [Beta vulgaris subsp. vulgaris]
MQKQRNEDLPCEENYTVSFNNFCSPIAFLSLIVQSLLSISSSLLHPPLTPSPVSHYFRSPSSLESTPSSLPSSSSFLSPPQVFFLLLKFSLSSSSQLLRCCSPPQVFSLLLKFSLSSSSLLLRRCSPSNSTAAPTRLHNTPAQLDSTTAPLHRSTPPQHRSPHLQPSTVFVRVQPVLTPLASPSTFANFIIASPKRRFFI